MARPLRRIVRAKVVARRAPNRLIVQRPRPSGVFARVVKSAQPKKLVAVRRVKPAAKSAPKKLVLRTVKKPGPKPGSKGPAGGGGGGSAFSQEQDDDESPSESESEVGPDDSGESSDSGSDSEGDEGEGDEGDEGEGDEGEGEAVGALIDTSNIDPAKAIVFGWVVFGVTLSAAMAIGWSWGRKHAR